MTTKKELGAFYSTNIKELFNIVYEDFIKYYDKSKIIYEPCCGNGDIINYLINNDFLNIDISNIKYYDIINQSYKNVIIQDTIIKNLKVCPANMNLAGAEVELVSMMSREQRLKEKLDVIKDEFDYILIDCPPSLGLITLNSFTASNSVLIPVQCEYFALEGLGQLINTINLVKKHLNKEIQIEGALLTMYDARTNLSNQVVKEVKKYFEDKVYKTVIPRNVRLSEAPSYGMPITEYDPRSKGAKSYMKFAKEFLKINDEQKKAKHMM